jgi:Putative transposase of IS4/5 family (DUF4096)
MWTKEHREAHKQSGNGFPSDLTDAQWARLEPLVPAAKTGGRPRQTDMRAAMNAIFYRLPLAVSAPRSVSGALDGLQHLPQVPARRRVGTDLGGVARGLARTTGPRGQPDGRHHRQPVAEGGGKRSYAGGRRPDLVG